MTFYNTTGNKKHQLSHHYYRLSHGAENDKCLFRIHPRVHSKTGCEHITHMLNKHA